MAKQAGVTRKQIYDLYFDRPKEEETRQSSQPGHRYEARVQVVQHATEFWCVWDHMSNSYAFGGQYTYLTQDVALTSAIELNEK
jgi:hypothetical protein